MTNFINISENVSIYNVNDTYLLLSFIIGRTRAFKRMISKCTKYARNISIAVGNIVHVHITEFIREEIVRNRIHWMNSFSSYDITHVFLFISY